MMLSKEELDLLLLYNAYLYKTAAEGILKGQFAINPYSENGRNIAPPLQRRLSTFHRYDNQSCAYDY